MIRIFTTLSLLTIAGIANAQPKNCFCDRDTTMNGATVSCDTTRLSNHALLYWQYNCDRIWLTLENSRKQQFELDEVPVELFGYSYRLGYQLIKAYKNSLLFRSGCAANGPCIYTLINKHNGKKIKEFDQLICIDTDVQWSNAHPYNFDFVVYLSYRTHQLIIYYINDKRKISIPFKEKLTAIIPEHQFLDMSLKGTILTLAYQRENKSIKKLRINLEQGNIVP